MFKYVKGSEFANELLFWLPINGQIHSSRSKPFPLQLWFSSLIDAKSVKINVLCNKKVEPSTIQVFENWEQVHWKYNEWQPGIAMKQRPYRILQWQHRFYNTTWEQYNVEYKVVGSDVVREIELVVRLSNGYLSDNEGLDLADEARPIVKLF